MKPRCFRTLFLLGISILFSLVSCVYFTPGVLISLLAPENQSTNQPLTVTLSWEAVPDQPDGQSSRGVYVAYYRVFLAISDHIYYEPFIVWPERVGTDNPEASNGVLTYTTATLARKTFYKWKIEAVKSDGSVTPSEEWSFKTGTGGMQYLPPTPMVEIGSGYFHMGDGLEEWETEWMGPVHNVIIGITYLMGIYEVTFDEYDTFCDDTGRSKPYDNGWGRGTRPVMNVNWWDAIAYCNWLSGKMGLSPAYDANGNMITPSGQVTRNVSMVAGIRLPTEAEWEYAARGGSADINGGVETNKYVYSGGNNLDEVAWYRDNSGFMSQPVGQKAPNELGIYDMTGNVEEWCFDWFANYIYSGSVMNPIGPQSGSDGRVTRGGMFYWWPDDSKLCFRSFMSDPSIRFYGTGFRIVRTVIE
jgi:formylglycine-generating enzyme required for sulfatase activity